MNKKRTTLTAFLAAVLVVAMAGALAACSQPATQRTSEKMDVNTDAAEAVNIETEPFYVLITGNDTRTGTSQSNKAEYADGNARTDTMMLTRVDPKNYLITFVSIPRDTKDELDDGTPCKINEHYNHGGIEETLAAVKRLTGVEPKYYLNTTFVGFEDLVNKLGGIRANVPITMSMKDIVSGKKITLEPGEQDLDGAETLVFARDRHVYDEFIDAEAYRQSDDRKIMEVIVTKVLSNTATVESMTESLYDFLDTNWDLASLKYIAKDFSEHADKVSFLSGTGPYEGGIDPEVELWLAYRDEDTWAEIMKVVNEGGDPNTVLQAPSMVD